MPFDLPRLRASLSPFRLHYVPTCSSTSDLAARMRREGRLFAPAVVVTSRQTRGRGRGNNRWAADSGTLTITFAFPIDEAHPPHHLPLLAGLAARDACQLLLGPTPEVQLKWPNDLLIENKKLAGLLCERVENIDLVGIGINVTTDITALPPAVKARATSLELAGISTSLTDVLLTLAAHLRKATDDRESFPALLRRYDTHHLLVGRKLTVKISPTETISGKCLGLDAQGRLLVQSQDTTLHRLISGTVESW